ncbi:glycosyltransferase family 2 protein [Microbacterium sp. STN6]|uniref:glycosyltransferase family 2 protein n=1 Tax=Microbacterium sp. STN6 TaxID=2995588 RepID=UPI002260EB6B|nr:glycosyltransferase family 2 protein [Microbacterium sp. STN6]MCX7521028.1 glycosyltransferase family 2 protein [Microbacterium sp. STN6]
MTSLLIDLLDSVAQSPHADPALLTAADDLRAALTPDVTHGPFLTVIVRTQGRRIETLKDALLCLAAQSCQDFDVIVADHDSDEVGAVAVRAAVDEQAVDFRSRISIAEVSGGGRAHPLNVALSRATGQYIAIYDDDDLLFGHWVETFRSAAETAGNRLIRAQVGLQNVQPEAWPDAEAGFLTLSSIRAEYPEEYDQLRHIRVNSSPFMGWAFPRVLFEKLGFRFDEELEVCEDWDVILRGASLLGVTNATELTSIYRRWENGRSSYDVHDLEEWQRSESRVIEKLDAMPLVLDRGAATQIRQVLVFEDAANAHAHLLAGWTWRLATPIRIGVGVVKRARPFVGRVLRRFHLR